MNVKKILMLFIFLFSFCFLYSINAFASGGTDDRFTHSDLAGIQVELTSDGLPVLDKFQDTTNLQQKSWNEFFFRYRGLLLGFSGICTLTFFAIFIVHITRFGQSAGNPTERSKMLSGILWSSLACGGFSAITIMMTMAFKMFQ